MLLPIKYFDGHKLPVLEKKSGSSYILCPAGCIGELTAFYFFIFSNSQVLSTLVMMVMNNSQF